MTIKETFKFSIRKLIRTKVNGGFILLFVALAAMIVANTPLKEYYHMFFGQEVMLTFGDFNLFETHHDRPMTFLDFINDALMAIFFFSVGLEIKREVLVGELSSPRKALLPVIAACGGMIVPVLLFTMIAPEGDAMKGAAIPMATDIAFSLGVLSLLGARVPLSLKIFLTAFAVVDDIGGIIIIALFYSGHVVWSYLLLAIVVVLVLIVGGKMGIYSKLFYAFFGIVVWYLFLRAGIHPTIAGVVVAFTVPARPKLYIYRYVHRIRESLKRLPENPTPNGLILSNSEMSILKSIESASDRVISPLQSLDDDLHSLVNYVIMPLFAFANAAISFEGITLASLQGVSITVFLSLVFGKLIGIFSFTFLAVKTRLLTMPDKMNNKSLLGIAMLGGVGFTVALFIANLSYGGIPEVGPALLNQAKIGIVCGSVFAGVVGYFLLKWALPEKKPSKTTESDRRCSHRGKC